MNNRSDPTTWQIIMTCYVKDGEARTAVTEIPGSPSSVRLHPIDDYQRRKAERVATFERTHGVKAVQCIACNGSGRYDHNGSPPCGACGGTGKVKER